MSEVADSTSGAAETPVTESTPAEQVPQELSAETPAAESTTDQPGATDDATNDATAAATTEINPAVDSTSNGDATATAGPAVPGPVASSEQPALDPGMTEKMVSVPNEMVGLIIGKAGATIRHIVTMSGARIQIAKECKPGESNREVTITGTPEQVVACESLVKLKAENKPLPGESASWGQGAPMGGMGMMGAMGGLPQDRKRMFGDFGGEPAAKRHDFGGEVATTKVMKVPNDCVGKVIGKGGCFIKQIKELSGAGVQIAKECQPSEPDLREVVMTGTPSQLAKCEEYVNMRTQGIMLPIDPHVAQMLMQPGGMGGGYGGAAGGYGQQAYGGGYAQPTFQAPPQSQGESTTVNIPEEYVGPIIGKMGRSIKELQECTGAFVQISNEGKVRSISVKGGPAEQAFCAKVLLERAGELEPRFAEYAMALRNHYGTHGQYPTPQQPLQGFMDTGAGKVQGGALHATFQQLQVGAYADPQAQQAQTYGAAQSYYPQQAYGGY
eukprot:m.1634988 g.1634988  ORF g.1634988 m.1634988 type:complete len:498 (+) comp25418_c2_seq2:137-1630(+)